MDIEPRTPSAANRFRHWAKTNTSLKLAVLFSIAFSALLMFSSFSYRDGLFLVSKNVWSDFMSHIPLVRSFTYGQNMPPEYPLFSGERIRYHFLFYLFASFFERAGLRLDLALNGMSILGMAGLMVVVYLLAYKLSGKKAASWLALIMLVFNSSLSWIYLFGATTGGVLQRIAQVVHRKEFLSFGPWDDRLISAFWNLNIFINQRHFPFSLALVFLAVWSIYYRTSALALIAGIAIIGVMSWLHKAALLLLLVTLGCFFFGDSKKRLRIFTAATAGMLLCVPGLLYLNSAGPVSDIGQHTTLFGRIAQFNPGFLYASVSWKEFPVAVPLLKWCVYWFLQLGLLPLAACSGWLLAGKPPSVPQRSPRDAESRFKKYLQAIRRETYTACRFACSEYRIWGVAGLVIFALANLFTFSPETAANHKLINYSVIIANIYAAVCVAHLLRKRIVFKISGLLLALALLLGGIVDFFPVINSGKVPWRDIQRDATAFWIVNNTKPQDRFFNLTYETASLAVSGRRFYWGWDYFPWSLGYDLPARKAATRDIVSGLISKDRACAFLRQRELSYIYMDAHTKTFMDAPINRAFFGSHFIKISPDTLSHEIYDVVKSCTPG